MTVVGVFETSAQPPRIPLVLFVVVVMLPDVGRMKSTMPPTVCVSAPKLRLTVPPVPMLARTYDRPTSTLVDATACELVAPLAPVNTKADIGCEPMFEVTAPPSTNAPGEPSPLYRMLDEGAPAAEKSRRT